METFFGILFLVVSAIGLIAAYAIIRVLWNQYR